MTGLDITSVISMIDALDKTKEYSYVSPKNSGRIKIHNVKLPNGPIEIKRYDPSKGELLADASVESISSSMILRIANQIEEGIPFNIDMILGASYNTRAVFESLLAHTRDFYTVYPGRIEFSEKTQKIKKGHKYLIYKPFGYGPKESDKLEEISGGLTMAVLPSRVFVSDNGLSDSEIILRLEQEDRKSSNQNKLDKDIALERMHSQIQVALVEIGKQFGYKTFIAKNDQSIKVNGQAISESESVITSLSSVRLISAFPEADDAGKLIDGMWFKGDKEMPAVFEVEHSTGVKSGLMRMKNFKDAMPPFPTKFIIVAPDDDRDAVWKSAHMKQFQELDTWYFPYSAVMELYALCKNWNIQGMNDTFIESFMEKVITE